MIFGADQRVTVGDDPHGVQQIDRQRVLQQEPAGAGTQRLVDVLVEVERGEDDDPRRRQRVVARDPPGRLEAVHHRHPNVHQHHVGPFAGGECNRLGAVARLADHLDVGLAGEQHREAAADERLVVGDHDSDRHATTTRIVMPPRPE